MSQEWNEAINKQLIGLQTRLAAIEKRGQQKQLIWLERIVYWLIIAMNVFIAKL
ncbi:hypothetical protein ACFLTT_03700 [Chloroflexota bacterium]